MKIWQLLRACPRWVRWLLTMHAFCLLLLLGCWGYSEYSRHALASKMAVDNKRQSSEYLSHLSYAKFTYEERGGFLIWYDFTGPGVKPGTTLQLGWSPRRKNVVAISSAPEQVTFIGGSNSKLILRPVKP
jgi:hypothetical protein